MKQAIIKIYQFLNNAGGLWGFIGLLILIITSFYTPINQYILNPTANFLTSIITFINYPILLPIWSFVLLLFLFLMLFVKYGDWTLISRNFIKEDLVIGSDELCVFISSETYPGLRGNTPCYAFRGNHYWEQYAVDYEQLRNSYWISDRELISDKEAEEGGYYMIEKKFEINFNNSQVKYAKLYFIVDDECTVILNGKRIEHYAYYQTLHEIELKDHIKRGENSLTFVIKNYEGVELKNPNSVYFSKKEKGKLNPYGIRFNLYVKRK